MSTSFSTALSGLNAYSTAISVVGNNLANLDTTGFKTVNVEFQDLVTQSIGADLGATQVGFGVGTPITLTNYGQGALESTGGALDAAIQGDGFFIVSAKGTGNTEYTRGGSFSVNTQGFLTTASGDLVQGWSMNNGVVDTNRAPGNISVPVGQLAPPVATTSMSASLNLNSAAAAGTSFSTSIQVYDSLGTAHTVTITFTQSGTPNQWNYSVSVPNSDLANPPYTPVTGTLTFDSNGNLTSPAATDAPIQVPITGLADGASDMNITWSLYNGTTPDITQYAQSSAASAQSQNGQAAANLVSIGLANGGQVLAQYSDGQQVVVGQMAMAQIENPDSLVAAGNSNYQASALTALPAIGLPGTGGRGTVVGGSVEASNVNIATEFTDLIVYQQGYEANAHVVTTENQLSQTTINLTQGA
ncbi:MAG TPA: flagellar hook protein FlgE [Bryobacteraceae bacterium]|jgi:flagellar hook protein FlgE|nr:flagellar hook protein FlgE [Bryobacteraceae bacterium]